MPGLLLTLLAMLASSVPADSYYWNMPRPASDYYNDYQLTNPFTPLPLARDYYQDYQPDPKQNCQDDKFPCKKHRDCDVCRIRGQDCARILPAAPGRPKLRVCMCVKNVCHSSL